VSDRPKRKLIEVALPLEAINAASAREGSIYKGNPSAIHKWWAQRPLAACRAVLFASLVDDPSSDPRDFPTEKEQEDERRRLFGIIERLVRWESNTDKVLLSEARAEILRCTDGNPPSVFDPFCGGGSIPLEAQRLGLAAHAADLNPVAVLITKSLIEIPTTFRDLPPVHPEARRWIGALGSWNGSAGLAADVRAYGAWMRDEAENRIGHHYPKAPISQSQGGGVATVIAWLWARTVTCPNPACGSDMVLTTKLLLSKKNGKETWARPFVLGPGKRVCFDIQARGDALASPKVGRGPSFRCLVCGQVAPEDHIKAEARAGRMGQQLMASVVEGKRGRIYLAPTEQQEAESLAVQSVPGLEEELSVNSRHSSPPSYGMTRFRDLFAPRQLMALATLCDLVSEARERVLRDAISAGRVDDGRGLAAGGTAANAYADAVAVYLAFSLDKTAEYNCTIVAWDPKDDRPKGLFVAQRIPMVWDFAEVNPLCDIGGSFAASCRIVALSIEDSGDGPAGRAVQADAAKAVAGKRESLVSTDPPYYDNVPYADLSDFFYVWLRRSLAGVFPELFGTLVAPKSAELVADATRFDSASAARDHFERGLRASFANAATKSRVDLPVTVYYAYKQAEFTDGGGERSLSRASTGWETMLEALLAVGLTINGTWPMRTERATRARSIASNALASSVVLVCRVRDADAGITTRRDFTSALMAELPQALRTLQHGNIAPVDLAQAAIGPGMAVFSRYSRVLEPDGSTMRVRTALGIINAALDELLAEQEGEFDADTRWAIAWYEQFGLSDAAYGTAETLSKAKNTSVAGVVEAGIVAASRGHVRLLARDEYSADWDPAKDRRIPVWEATQRLVDMLLTDGEAAAGDLLARLGGLGETARDLAYRMYHVAERKGWTDEARAYNALVVAWTDLARGAESARAAQPAQTNLGLA
jgi:putative DNA methylase